MSNPQIAQGASATIAVAGDYTVGNSGWDGNHPGDAMSDLVALQWVVDADVSQGDGGYVIANSTPTYTNGWSVSASGDLSSLTISVPVGATIGTSYCAYFQAVADEEDTDYKYAVFDVVAPETGTDSNTEAHGTGVEVRIYDPSGLRRHLPSSMVGEATWTIEPLGGYSDFSLTLHCQPSELTSIAAGDRIEIWDLGVRQFRGYAGDLTRSEEEPPQLTVAGYGRVLDLERMVLDGAYQRAAQTDISDFFAEIASDVQARYPEIVVSVDYIGVSTQSLDGRAKTAKDVLDTLVGLASSVAVYGFDVDDAGRDRLYLRLIDSTVVDATIAISGRNVGKRESATRVSDVVNVVSVVGGTPDFPQLLPNGSFEVLVRGGQNGDTSSGDNAIQNGSFEGPGYDGNDNNEGWTLSNGASLKKNGGSEPDARTGKWSVEIDHVGELLSQTTDSPPVAITPGHQYEIGAWLRPEYNANLGSPPVVTLTFNWRISGADQSATTWTYTVSEATYRATYQTLTAPAGATGFKFQIELTHLGSGGGNNDGVMVDDLYVIDVSSLVADKWDAITHGSAEVTAINWSTRDAYDGRNCLYLDATAEDTDGQDVHIRCIPNYYAQVAGGQTVRFSARVKSVDGAAAPKFFLVQQFYKSDGSVSGSGEHRHTFGSTTYSDWTYISCDEAAPGDAAKVECWLCIRGNGSLYVDAVSARIVPDSGDESTTDTTYLPPGNLQVTYRADDLVSADENAAVHNSISVYGIREKVESVSDLTTLTDAKAWATSYLIANAIATPSPVIDLYDDPRSWAIGQVVRLTGDNGSAYAASPLPILRINGSISAEGLLTHSIEIGRTRPTDEELIARLANRNVYQVIQSASGASSSSVGGSQLFDTTAGATTTTVTGILKGSSGSIVAATADVDYAAATHAARHASGGADAVSLDASQIVSGTISTARLGSGTADSTTYLRGDGTWTDPSTSGSSTGTYVSRLETGGGTTETYGSEIVQVVTDTARTSLTIGFTTASPAIAIQTIINAKGSGDLTVSLSSGTIVGGDITLSAGQWCRLAGVYSGSTWTAYRVG